MAVAAPARRTAPAPRPSRTSPPPPRRKPARKAPSRSARVAAPARRAPARSAGQLIPLAVGRTAVAVRDLPDSGLVVRMTRGRAWIGVLGLLLAGIVALNVITLSFAASVGHIDEQMSVLSKENTGLEVREAQAFSTDRVREAAVSLGLGAAISEEPRVIEAGSEDLEIAAQRLAAAGGG
jgi:hypothetical protein